MDYQNLRGWIAAVDELGELERLAGVDSDLELATITELVLRERRPPPASCSTTSPAFRRATAC